MKRLLSSTTALSLAMFNVQPWPLMAQTLTADGYVVASDGTVLCAPSEGAECFPEDYVGAAQEIDAAIAAQAEAEAQAQAEAEAAAQAEAEAEAQAEAEAAAQAEAEAQAQAEAEAAAQAEAEAQAQAEAEAAAQAEAEAAAADEQPVEEVTDETATEEVTDEAATEEVTDEAAAEEVTDETATEEVTDETATEEVTDEAAAEEVTDETATEEVTDETATEEVTDEAATEEVTDETATEEVTDEATTEEVTDEAATDEAPVEEPLDPAVLEEQAAAFAAAEEELAVEDDGTLVDPAAGLKTAEPAVAEDTPPVDTPEVTEAEVESLSQIIATPDQIDPAALEAASALAASPADAQEPLPLDEIAPSADATSLVTEVLTEQTTRTSAQEFAAAPRAVGDGKKSGLSDLEKVGLVALGALVVGAIINDIDNKRDEQQRRVVSNTGDRVVVLNPDGTYQVYKDDDAVLRRPGSTVRTETFRDGSTRTIVERRDGTQVVTIRDASGRVLRRAHYDNLGRELVLIDDLEPEDYVYVEDLPKPRKTKVVISTQDEDADLKAALAAKDIEKLGRKFSLRQIREIPQVRALAATIDVDSITFDSGSSAIKADQAEDLADLGSLMQDMIDENPAEMFLIEGHTDAVGKAAMNLALSDRRAESVALALTEYFDIPPENMVVQGYGESELRIDTQGDEKRNRRVAVRIITPLLKGAQ